MSDSHWWQLIGVFAPLSFLSIGGGQSIVGDIQKQVVHDHHWLTHDQFLDDFAISRASAGPNTMIVTLIGWQVGGLWGAVAASLAIFLPSSLMFYGLTLVSRLPLIRGWQNRLARGLAPLSIGLTLGSAFSILTAKGSDVWGWTVSLACVIALQFSKVNPFVLLAAGGAAFALKGWLHA